MAELSAKKKKASKKAAVKKNPRTSPSLKKYTGWITVGGLFLIFLLTRWFDAGFSWLIGGLTVLLGVICYDIYARRKWEDRLMGQITELAFDYERLVREVARNRNDIAGLKKSLSEAGESARMMSRGTAAESRMLQAIVDKLSNIGGAPRPAVEQDVAEPRIEASGAVPIGRDRGEFIASQIGDDVVLELIRHAVRYDKVELFMQPVVTLPQRKPRYYEVFSRIRAKAGLYLPAHRYIRVALKHDLVAAIDNLLLLRCLQMIRAMDAEQRGESFFVNIAGMTLHDAKFMGDLVEFLSQYRELAPRLIFELTQADLESLDPSVFPVLDGLSRLGCRFSVDGVKALSLDLTLLEARHIRFVKIEAEGLLRALNARGGLRRLKQFKAELDRSGIDLIVEKIEQEKELIELLDLDIDFGQGYLFGRPELREEAA